MFRLTQTNRRIQLTTVLYEYNVVTADYTDSSWFEYRQLTFELKFKRKKINKTNMEETHIMTHPIYGRV